MPIKLFSGIAAVTLAAFVRGVLASEGFTHAANVFLAAGGLFGWLSFLARYNRDERRRRKFVDGLIHRGDEVLAKVPQDVLDEVDERISQEEPDRRAT